MKFPHNQNWLCDCSSSSNIPRMSGASARCSRGGQLRVALAHGASCLPSAGPPQGQTPSENLGGGATSQPKLTSISTHLPIIRVCTQRCLFCQDKPHRREGCMSHVCAQSWFYSQCSQNSRRGPGAPPPPPPPQPPTRHHDRTPAATNAAPPPPPQQPTSSTTMSATYFLSAHALSYW